ncbi:hypothetical protein FKM82_005625 [Ascaphus truei]
MCVTALPLLLLLLLHLPLSAWAARPPRVYLSYRDLMESRTARSFSFGFNTSDYRILLLDQDQDRMYVGSRDYVLSLDLGNINREPLIVDYMGTDSAIFRTMGHTPPIRTEQYDSRWLNVPGLGLCGSESSFREDDKLYILFRERSLEGENGPANDEGGMRSLVGKWTSFLKARLVCSVIGQDGVETLFDQLRDGGVVTSPYTPPHQPLLYAGFNCVGFSVPVRPSVILSCCVRAVFNGPFAHKEGHGYQMTAYTGKTPYPRPGATLWGVDVLRFVRTHPLNEQALCIPSTASSSSFGPSSYTSPRSIAGDTVRPRDGDYTVLFLVMILPRGPEETEGLILEEVEVFRVPSPVKNIRISSKRHQLYISSAVGLTQLSLHRCAGYGDSCADCCLARDPYCAWDGRGCVRYTPSTTRRSRRQDVRHGDPMRQCRGYNMQGKRQSRRWIWIWEVRLQYRAWI